MFLSRHRNTSGSLREREMLWEHELLASVSTEDFDKVLND